MNSFLNALMTVALGWVTLALGWLGFWVRNKLRRAHQMESERDLEARKALEKLLDVWSERLSLISSQNKPLSLSVHDLEEMSRKLVVWAPDEVLIQYESFLEKRSPDIIKSIDDHEIPFGMAILAFRKHLGFRNKRDKLTPKRILAVFKAGWKKPL